MVVGFRIWLLRIWIDKSQELKMCEYCIYDDIIISLSMGNKIFKSQIGRNVEVYVDDMLVKSARALRQGHAGDFRRTQVIQNEAETPESTFWGHFGHIEDILDKIRAILGMQEPKTPAWHLETQWLRGCPVSIPRQRGRKGSTQDHEGSVVNKENDQEEINWVEQWVQRSLWTSNNLFWNTTPLDPTSGTYRLLH